MIPEVSAGGLVVCKHAQSWQVLLMRDMKGNWTFPKGMIESGETPETAAKREIFEEVGVKNLEMIKPLDSIHYKYRRDDLINKTVHYFLFQSLKNVVLKPQIEEGVNSVRWVAFKKALEVVGYAKTNKPLLEKAVGILDLL